MQTSAQPSLSAPVLAVFQQAALVFKPPPRTTVTQWAERERMLSTESSATAGRYRCDLAPYQREMQDAAAWPGVEEVVLWTGTQMGKSTDMENVCGYYMQEDPSPIIFMWPSEKMAKEWSIDTLDPMMRDTRSLARRIEANSRSSSNSKLYKKFPGGSLTIIGANSPASLRRRRARILLADEVDLIGVSAGMEGDPIQLVVERSQTFWNAVRVLASTCTIKGESRIEARYEISDRRKYWVPCPHCSEYAGKPDGFQLLSFSNLVQDKVSPHEGTVYPCEHCAAALTELDKPWMLRHGEWRAENPAETRIKGFWINSMYSPFFSWAKMVAQFLEAMAHRENPNILQVFYNAKLAKTWELREEYVGTEELKKRVEEYPALRPRPDGPAETILPREVCVLTAGVDVQADRLELELTGWGCGEESWSIDFTRFEGDTAQPEVWEKLDGYLLQHWPHALAPDDVRLEIAATFVDSGFRAAHVYNFTKTRGGDRRVFASKGISGFGKPALGKWNRNNQARVRLYPIAVDVLKELVYSRLRIEKPGVGFMHFSRRVNLEENPDYFEQLTAEKIERKPLRGFPMRFWYLPPGKRNEALDCRVYATAALHSLVERTPLPVLLDRLHRELVEEAREMLARRRAKIDPNQLALPVAEELLPVAGGPLPVEAVSPQTPQEPGRQPEPATAAPAAPPDDEPPPAPQAPTRIRRRSSWL